MIKKIVTPLIFIFLSIYGSAQVEKGLDDVEQMKIRTQQIVDDFTKNDFVASFDKLEKIWILPKNEMDHLGQKSIEQLNLIQGRIGKSMENILVKEKMIDNLLYELVYVVKYEIHGLRLRFIFYNGVDGKWLLNNFQWDDNIMELLND